MSFPARVALIFFAASMLSGCGSVDTSTGEPSQSLSGGSRETIIEEPRRAVATGSQFSRELYHGYMDLAEQEFGEGDYDDAKEFSQRALRSAAGTPPEPAQALVRKLPRENKGESVAARARLMYSLSNGGRERWPQEAARAQLMYDCWAQEQEENSQPEHIRECRNSFMFAMARLEAALWPRSRKVAKAPDSGPGEIEQGHVSELPADSRGSSMSTAAFIVYFDFDRSALTPSGRHVLKEVVDHLQSRKVSRIDLVGHADRSGEVPYNQNLSMRRAQKVAAALQKAGIDKSLFGVAAMGENMPAVPTEDGVRNPQNRRVEIHFSDDSTESKDLAGSAPPQSPSQ